MDRLSERQPPEPFQAIARKAARAQVESGPLDKIMNAPLCRQRLELSEYGILEVQKKEPLAVPFLLACAAAQADDDPGGALRLHSILRTKFPKEAAGKASVTALGQVVSMYLTKDGVKEGKRMGSGISRPALGGKSQIRVMNGRVGELEIILAGQKQTRVAKLKSCKNCSRTDSDTVGLQQCDRSGASETTVTLPAGRYNYAAIDGDELERPGSSNGICSRTASTRGAGGAEPTRSESELAPGYHQPVLVRSDRPEPEGRRPAGLRPAARPRPGRRSRTWSGSGLSLRPRTRPR